MAPGRGSRGGFDGGSALRSRPCSMISLARDGGRIVVRRALGGRRLHRRGHLLDIQWSRPLHCGNEPSPEGGSRSPREIDRPRSSKRTASRCSDRAAAAAMRGTRAPPHRRGFGKARVRKFNEHGAGMTSIVHGPSVPHRSIVFSRTTLRLIERSPRPAIITGESRCERPQATRLRPPI